MQAFIKDFKELEVGDSDERGLENSKTKVRD